MLCAPFRETSYFKGVVEDFYNEYPEINIKFEEFNRKNHNNILGTKIMAGENNFDIFHLPSVLAPIYIKTGVQEKLNILPNFLIFPCYAKVHKL